MSWKRVVCEARHSVRVALRSAPSRPATLPHPSTAHRLCPPILRAGYATNIPRTASRDIDNFLAAVCEGTTFEYADRIRSVCLPALAPFENKATGRYKAVRDTCAALAQLGDLAVLHRALLAVETHFGQEIDDKIHTAILRGFQFGGHFEPWAIWLKDVTCETSVQRWNVFFEHCLFRGQYQQVWTWMHYILKTPPLSPSRKTYFLFFQAVFFLDNTKPPPFEVIRRYIASMKRHDVPFGDEILQVLVEGYGRMNAQDEARQVQELYLSARDSNAYSVDPDPKAWTEQLLTLLANGEDKKANHELKRMLHSGFTPTPATLDAIAEYIRSSDTLLHWERALDVTASRSAWSVVLRNTAKENTARATLAAYRMMLERKHIPSPSDILSILETVCSNRVVLPTDEEVHRVAKLFDEYISLTASDATRNPQDDFPAYDILLRTICNTRRSTLVPVAARLLHQMRRRGIVEDRHGAQPFDEALMRSASNAGAAYEVYKLLYGSKDGDFSLDAKGFEAVLGIFLAVHPNHESFAPIYLEIVSDMQRAGYPSTPAVYTRLLRALRHVLPSPEEDLMARGALAGSIVQVHNAVSIDATLVPDTTLWNALMDAYQHAFCFPEAFRLWETLFVAQRFDPATVDVVLGACARGGLEARAKDTVVRLHKLGYPFDQQNWASWVACLCRLGRLEEATNVLCIAMVQEAEQGKDVRPTKEIAEVILKAAAGKGMLEEIRGRIHASLPDLKVDEITVGHSAS